MRKINYNDLQLDIEKYYQKKINATLKKLKNLYPFVDAPQYKKEHELYTLVSNAIRIDEHYVVRYLTERIRNNLSIDVNISMMLHQSESFKVTCLNKGNDRDDILILVSQHFFNNLNEDEQVFIIGHEIAHFLFGHIRYPINEILSFSFEISEINGLKGDLLSWSIACEITADLVGLVASDFNYKACKTAIIKHFTGLNDSSHSKFNLSPVVDLVLDHYDKLASDPLFAGEISTHPLMPLRVKIIGAMKKCKLVKCYNEEISKKRFDEYCHEFNKTVNDLIHRIYPEILPGSIEGIELLKPLSVAVAISDGKFDQKELKAIDRIIGSKNIDEESSMIEYSQLSPEEMAETMNRLINDGVHIALKKQYTKQTIVPIIRRLLVIAASDGIIEKCELDAIYTFAKNFHFSRLELIIILQSHNIFHAS